MELAAQLFTVREFTKTPEDIKKTFKKIKEIGYNAVQISALGPIEPSMLKEFADEYDIKICASHTPFVRIVEDTERVIAEHKLYQCPYIGMPGIPGEYINDKAGYDAFLDKILPATEKIADEGLKFLYHNHHIEFRRIDGRLTGIEYMAEKTDPEKFGFLADLYWVQAGGASPVSFIKRHANRMHVIHFKDMMIREDGSYFMTEILEGNMDYDEIYRVSLENGVEWVAVEQDTCPANPFDSLKTSYVNMKNKNWF